MTKIIEPKIYSPLNTFFLQAGQKNNESDSISEQMIMLMAPGSFMAKEGAEKKVLNYRSLTAQQVIELVSHYIVNVMMPFFAPENSNDKDVSIMPLSEEFAEEQFSIESLINQQNRFVFEQQENRSSMSQSTFCGACLANCLPDRRSSIIRNPAYQNNYRNTLFNHRINILAPTVQQMQKLIKSFCSRMELDKNMVKAVVLQALILIERAITQSQKLCHNKFQKYDHSDIFHVLNDLIEIPQTNERQLTINITTNRGPSLTFNQKQMWLKTLEIAELQPLRPLFQVMPYNWKPILYTALAISVKFQEDLSIETQLLCRATRMFNKQQTNKWMNVFTSIIDFEFHVDFNLYDNYFKWLIIYNKFIEQD